MLIARASRTTTRLLLYLYSCIIKYIIFIFIHSFDQLQQQLELPLFNQLTLRRAGTCTRRDAVALNHQSGHVQADREYEQECRPARRTEGHVARWAAFLLQFSFTFTSTYVSTDCVVLGLSLHL